jgi:hypothetical protein
VAERKLPGTRAIRNTAATLQPTLDTKTIRMTTSRSLAFLADPALAASVLPGHGGGFESS